MPGSVVPLTMFFLTIRIHSDWCSIYLYNVQSESNTCDTPPLQLFFTRAPHSPAHFICKIMTVSTDSTVSTVDFTSFTSNPSASSDRLSSIFNLVKFHRICAFLCKLVTSRKMQFVLILSPQINLGHFLRFCIPGCFTSTSSIFSIFTRCRYIRTSHSAPCVDYRCHHYCTLLHSTLSVRHSLAPMPKDS